MYLSLFHHAFFISGETLFEALARLVFHVYIFPKCYGFHKHKYEFQCNGFNINKPNPGEC